MRTKLMLVAALVVGVAIGTVAGPVLGGSVSATTRTTHVYRCVAEQFQSMSLFLVNPTTATVRAHVTSYDEAGTVLRTAVFPVPKHAVSVDNDTGVAWTLITARSPLVVDMDVGSGDAIRRSRCT